MEGLAMIVRMKLVCSIALALGILIQTTGLWADYYYAGIGAISCGKLIQDYRQNPTQVDGLMLTWAQGFMSAVNANEMLNHGTYRDLQAMAIEAQQESLRSYCDKHPMADFWNAALDLLPKLPLKKWTPPTSTSH
jgi:hypothetical protein